MADQPEPMTEATRLLMQSREDYANRVTLLEALLRKLWMHVVDGHDLAHQINAALVGGGPPEPDTEWAHGSGAAVPEKEPSDRPR